MQEARRAADASDEARPIVRLSGVTKTYGQLHAIDHLDLDIRPRELFTLLGPSGSGKSTVLRAIAGLIGIDGGRILIDGQDVRDVPTYRRNIGMVFQSLALFPHMTVFDNIAFPLRMRRRARSDIARQVGAALDVVRLPRIAGRRVHELSGGQQQRVALARALVYNPRLLLLDEPFGALDKRLREEMQLEVVRLHREIDVTIINVTHDQVEAMILSDRIGVMNEGRLEQVATGEELYRRPRTRFIADFLGRANCVDGRVRRGPGDAPALVTEGGAALPLPAGTGAPEGARGSLVIRAEDIALLAAPPAAATEAALAGRVDLRLFEGEAVYYEVAVPGLAQPLRVASRSGAFGAGAEVWASWRRDAAWLIAEGAGRG